MLRKLFRNLLTAVLLVGTIAAGSPPAAPAATPAPVNVTLNVYAAASLPAAFTELGQRFSLYNPGVKVVFNFAGSQLLSQQIVQGAPADVFASANTAQMSVAAGSGREDDADDDDPPTPATGVLVFHLHVGASELG